MGKLYVQAKWQSGSGIDDGQRPTPKVDIQKSIQENDLEGYMVCKLKSFQIAKMVVSWVEPYIEIEYPNGRVCKTKTFPNVVAKFMWKEQYVQKLFMRKADAKGCKIRIMNFDPTQGKSQQLVAHGAVKGLESCYAKPCEWAITDQNLALESEPSFAQQQKSDKCHVTFDMKWVPEGSPMLDDAHPTPDDLETEKIFKTVQSEYSDDIIKGRLRISMSHARDLTSPDGSKKSVNHP